MPQDFERLQILFSRVGTLPELSGNVPKLTAVIDSGEASAIDLEKIIGADPALSVAILRIANTRWEARDNISTIRSAVMLLGQQTVRNMAMSWMIQGMLQKRALSPLFSVERYTKHCAVTGQVARYVYARRQMKGDVRSTWTADEVFAAALLHDLGIALLVCLAPDSYQRVYTAAERFQISINEAFQKIYNRSLNELAGSAVKAWKLPQIFEDVVRYVNEPWAKSDQFEALACINYADYLASVCGCTLERWALSCDLGFDVKNAVELSEDEAARVLHLVNENADKYIGPAKAHSEPISKSEKTVTEVDSDILVVDDNEMNRGLIGLVLDHFGYPYRLASNGNEAVQAFSERRPILVLMDLNMPVLDGFDATKEIRALEKGSGARTPIIALTARAQSNDEKLCLSVGMDDHVEKPLMIASFGEKLARWLPSRVA